MSDRLTRKEIKRQDSFQETLVHSLEWVRDHGRQIAAGAAALALAVLGLAAWFLYAGIAEGKAQALLAEAIEAHGAPVRPQEDPAAPDRPGELSFPSEEARRARSAELFERVVAERRTSDAAAVARVYLGRIAAAEGDAERARSLWRDFLRKHPRHMLGAEVRLNLYALDRADGRGEEVATELRAMLADDRRPLPMDVVLFELATTLEALDRADEAAEHYQALVNEFTESPYAFAARQKTGGAGVPGAFAGLGS